MDNNQLPFQIAPPRLTNPTILHRPPGETTGDRATKRPRASKPKVKSGCLSCKARRIKCDETKPECLRCQKFGRPCEGYTKTPPPPRGPIQIQPRIVSAPTVYRPSVSINATENESRYFQVFVEHAAEELSGYFDSTFWSQIVLQESHEVTAIRHAAIALGAMNKSVSMAPSPSLKVNVLQTFEKSHHEQAVLHYHKAIQLLNQYISESSSPQLRTTLIACILFVCFESIQGSYGSSIQQQYGGLKLLRSYYRGKSNSVKKRAPTETNADLDTQEADNLMSAEIRDYFESDAWYEEPPATVSMRTLQILETSEPDFTHRTSTSNAQEILPSWETSFADLPASTFNFPFPTLGEGILHQTDQLSMSDPSSGQWQLGQIEFTEPNYQINKSSTPARRASDNYHQTSLTAPSMRGPLKRSFSQEQQHQQTLDITYPTFIKSEPYPGRARTMSTLSVNDTSSAYSSDSGSYREPSPHLLQPPTLQSSTLSSSYTYPSYNNPEILIPAFVDSSRTTTSTIPSHTHTPSSTNPSPARSPKLKPLLKRTLDIEDSIIQTFARLLGPGLFFGLIPGIPVLHWDIHQTYHLLPIPPVFSNYNAAQHTWDFLMDRALQFYRTTLYHRAHKPTKLSPPQKLAAQHNAFIKEISAFEKAFQPILDAAILVDSVLDGRTTVVHAPSLLLSLYTKATLILLSQTTSPSEMVYDTYLPLFQQIIHTATLLLSPSSSGPQNPRFTFSIGIIPPLHLTATKCRDGKVRREAVELLFRSPRQEGLWDGILSARVGRWLIGVEEDGMVVGDEFDGGGNGNGKSGKPPDDRIMSETYIKTQTGHDQDVETTNPSISTSNTITLPQRSRSKHHSDYPHRKIDIKPEDTGTSDARQPNSKLKQHITIPERNRAQLTMVSFHIPDRYIKVKCQRVLGDREVRETVIAW